MHLITVKNTYDFSNNIIVTGPNASGKTTLLKATMFNIIVIVIIGLILLEKKLNHSTIRGLLN